MLLISFPLGFAASLVEEPLLYSRPLAIGGSKHASGAHHGKFRYHHISLHAADWQPGECLAAR